MARLQPRPEEVAPGVHRLETGRGITEANVYLVRSGSSWVLIDTAWPSRAGIIRAAAEALFGPGTRPTAIVLTHIHPDHAGAALELARTWQLPVHVHPDELPMASGGVVPPYANPLDRWLIGPLLRLMPRRRVEAMLSRDSLEGTAVGFNPAVGVPGLPDWQCVPAPGHTPGHVAFFRSSDGVLITGDSVVTVNLNSVSGFLFRRPEVSGPPRYTTWDWTLAKQSIELLSAREPRVLAPGHGRPLLVGTTPALRALAERLGPPRKPVSQGLFRPVEYSARRPYRRPPRSYLRRQWIGPLATTLGLSPKYVVTLEVLGRRSGVVHRTSLVRATLDGEHYLVALAGESEWVRNVRAAQGHVAIGRRRRHAATLVGVLPQDRPPVIRAYLLRARRRAGSKSVANEARAYFGVSADPSIEEIRAIADRYPVFRIIETAR